MNALKAGMLSLCLLTGAVAPAGATSITISDVGVTYYENVSLTGGALGSGTLNAAFSGQINLSSSIGNLGVWCVDLFHEIFLGGHYTATTAPYSSNNSTPSTSLTADQISQVSAIAAFGNALLQPSTNRTFDPATLAAFSAGVAQFQSAAPTDYAAIMNGSPNSLSTLSAAVQAAIWNVIYGTTATNSSDAHFATDLAIILANARDYFGNIGGYQLDIVDAQGNQVQRQFLSQVPEPATLGLILLGFAGLFAMRRRLNSRA